MQIYVQFFIIALVELTSSIHWSEHKLDDNNISSKFLGSSFLVTDIEEILSAGLFSDILLIIESDFNIWRK